MNWLGMRTKYDGVFNPAGLGQPVDAAMPAADTLLAQGSLLLEVEIQPTQQPVNLLRYAVLDPWPAGVTILQEPDGTIRLLLRQGPRHLATSLRTDLGTVAETIHITYSWDAPARSGRIGIRAPDRDKNWQTEVLTPFPLSLRDCRRLLTDHTTSRVDKGLTFAAIADGQCPQGPTPGIGAGAMIETQDGPRAIEKIRPGDLVLSPDGNYAQVRWAGSLTLPCAGRFAPLLVRGPYHGLERDLILAADQRIGLSGSEIEYLFGEERVSTAVRHLSDRHSVYPIKSTMQTMTYYQVLLDQHTEMNVNGAWIESFDVASITATPNLMKGSILADLPCELRPETPTLCLPVLQGFETLTLTGASYG